jgi:NitT/TauT family transport system substrate-binding protein
MNGLAANSDQCKQQAGGKDTPAGWFRPGSPSQRPMSLTAILMLLFLGAMLTGPKSVASQEPALTRVSFLPQWQPQAQFAGYFVAYEKGLYRQRGLEVKILPGGPENPPAARLAQGRADFGTLFLATGIERWAGGLKLVNIAQMVQRSALMLVAKKSSGIKTPTDMDGKKVSLWPSELRASPLAFFQAHGVKVKVIPQSANLNLFLRDGVEVGSAMWYNEYHQLLQSGMNPEELNTFLLADYGLNFPEDGIYCLADLVERRPQICRAFVLASIEGWQYAFAHPEEALDIVMQYVRAANVASDRVHQKWMLEHMRQIMLPAGFALPMGTLRPAIYEQVAQEMLRSGLIKQVPDFSKIYKDMVADDAK